MEQTVPLIYICVVAAEPKLAAVGVDFSYDQALEIAFVVANKEFAQYPPVVVFRGIKEVHQRSRSVLMHGGNVFIVEMNSDLGEGDEFTFITRSAHG